MLYTVSHSLIVFIIGNKIDNNKSWMKLFSFCFRLMTLGNTGIYLFFHQLFANSRTEWVL